MLDLETKIGVAFLGILIGFIIIYVLIQFVKDVIMPIFGYKNCAKCNHYTICKIDNNKNRAKYKCDIKENNDSGVLTNGVHPNDKFVKCKEFKEIIQYEK